MPPRELEREWVAQTLSTPLVVKAFVDDRVWQGESVTAPPSTKPFIVYRMGNTSPDNMVRVARRQYFTVYFHDEANPGDYSQIDDMMQTVMDVFEAAPPSPEHNIYEARWLENSSDQDDREMGTILRYSRYQLIMSKWTTEGSS